MKKLNITKEQFNRSHYFKNKYGRLEYVSESGKVFKTSKGKILKDITLPLVMPLPQTENEESEKEERGKGAENTEKKPAKPIRLWLFAAAGFALAALAFFILRRYSRTLSALQPESSISSATE